MRLQDTLDQLAPGGLAEYRISADQAAAARRTIAAYALDAVDAAELMRALGIHPSDDQSRKG